MPYLFCCVHEAGNFSAKDNAAFLQRLMELRNRVPKEKSLQLWATNLEYDLVNLFGPERIREVQLRFGRSYLVSARWKGIEFRDTGRHIQASVKQLGDLVKLPKLDRPTDFLVPRTQEEWNIAIRYCMRDANISFRVAKELHEIYAGIGVRARTTLASTAYHLWEEKYFGRKISHTPDEIREAAKEAYFGGRTEPFFIGEFQDVAVIDIASMYPWAMVAREFPAPWGATRIIGPEFDVKQATNRAFLARARIETDSRYGLLPFRSRNFSTSYPTGDFTGWYVGEELVYAVSRGANVTIIEGFEFLETLRPFDRYVSDIFDLKNRSRGTLKTVYKLLLNSLYGKFGSSGSRITATPLEDWEANERPHEWDCRVWNGLVIYRCDAPPPPWGNMIWAAIVTARARIRLHQEIVRLDESGARVLYCDTDSVFYHPGISTIRYKKHATAPGDWEVKGNYKSLFVAGKKEYILEHRDGTSDVHAKGIPYAARENYIREGHAVFSRPTRMLESTRTGIKANVWSERTKERHINYRDRIRDSAGFLFPVCVRRGEIVTRSEVRRDGSQRKRSKERGKQRSGCVEG